MKNTYYCVNHIDFARALLFITGQNYMVFDDKRDSSKKVYSFQDNKRLRTAIDKLTVLKKEFNN